MIFARIILEVWGEGGEIKQRLDGRPVAGEEQVARADKLLRDSTMKQVEAIMSETERESRIKGYISKHSKDQFQC